MTSSTSASTSALRPGDIQDVAKWTGKRFGTLRGVRVIEQDIRILSHSGGFAVFLPNKMWRRLDHQVPLNSADQEDSACWIADKDFAFLKVDIDSTIAQGSDKEYVSENLEVALNKIHEFVRKNFFENKQAYPDSEYFSYGSFLDKPNMPRPFRLRLGGDFHYQI